MAVQRVSPAARCEINNAVGPREEEEDESNFAPGRLYYACCRPMRAHEESSRSPINRACRDRNSSAYAVPFLGDAVSNDFCGKGYSPCSSSMGADIPLELHKLFFTLGFLVIAAVSNWISLSYIHDVAGREPLPDALFSLLPETSWALEVGDLMVTLCALSAIVVCFLHRYRFVVLRRLLFIAAVLYTLRSLTLLATQLPSGYSDNETRCRERLNGTDRTLKVYFLRTIEQTIHIGFQDIEAKMLCGDLLFSGHTLVMIVSWLMVDYYLPKPYRWFRFVPMVFAVIGMVCMVVSRTHYSVDVLVAYLLSLLVFSIYHAFTEVDTYRERKNSALSRIWIMWIVFWLEDNVVPGRLENEFSFPCCGESDDRLPTTTESMSSSSSVPVIQAA